MITFLGFGRIIYYGYFKATFNHFLFQSTHEDPWVLLSTLHHDYPFWWLFPVFLIALFFFFKAWSLISEKFLYPLPIFRHSYQKELFSFLLLLRNADIDGSDGADCGEQSLRGYFPSVFIRFLVALEVACSLLQCLSVHCNTLHSFLIINLICFLSKSSSLSSLIRSSLLPQDSLLLCLCLTISPFILLFLVNTIWQWR